MRRYCAYSLLAAGLWFGGPAAAQTSRNTSVVPRLVRFSGAAQDIPGNPVTRVAAITFALYTEQTGGEPLWTETQNVHTSLGGHYTVLLGAASHDGLPVDVFTSGQAHWIGVSVEGQAEQPRVLLVSAPYALKAGDAETIGGLPASAFLRAAPVGPAENAGAAKPEAAREVSPDTACAAIASDGTATANEVAKFTAPCTVEPSAISESGGKVGIGTTTPAATLDVKGAAVLRSTLTMNAKGAATGAAGANSNPLDLLAASFDSATSTPISQHFRWQAEAAGNDTASPSGTLNLLYAPGSGTPAETGLSVNSQGLLTFGAGQTFPGAGTVTGVAAGGGLSGGGTSGTVTVGLTHTCASGQVLQWNGSTWACETSTAGTITGLTAGAGLNGGGTSGSLTLANTGVLSVTAGTGITSSGGNTPTVSLNTGFTDGRYVQPAGGTLSGAVTLPANGLTAAGNQLVLAGGNLGIGTATPEAPLEVAGNVKISGAGSGLRFPDGSTQAKAGNPAGLLAVNPLQVALLKWFPAYQSSIAYTVGNTPLGIAFDGTDLWVANQFGNNVTKLLASTGAVVSTYSAGNQPYGVAFDGANIWVTNLESNNVTKLRASDGACLGTCTFPVGINPLGVTFDGANIWVANNTSGTLTKLRASDGACLGTCTFPAGTGPEAMVFDGANIWVTNWGDNTVSKLLASTGAVLDTYPVGTNPKGIAYDGTNIWVVNVGSSTVTKLSAATGATVGTYGVGASPIWVVFDGAYIWVTNWGANAGNTVTKLAASTGAVVGTFTTGAGAWGIAFDGANVWVANVGDNTVSKL